MRLRAVIPTVLALLVLAGCTAPPATSTTPPDETPVVDQPAAAPDCEAVRVGFEELTASEGAAMGFSLVDPAELDGVNLLPADVLATGCAVQNPVGAGGDAFFPNDGDVVSDQLTALLEQNGFTLDIPGAASGTYDVWTSSTTALEVTPFVYADNAGGAGLSADILAPFGDGTRVLWVTVR